MSRVLLFGAGATGARIARQLRSSGMVDQVEVRDPNLERLGRIIDDLGAGVFADGMEVDPVVSGDDRAKRIGGVDHRREGGDQAIGVDRLIEDGDERGVLQGRRREPTLRRQQRTLGRGEIPRTRQSEERMRSSRIGHATEPNVRVVKSTMRCTV